MGGCAAQNGGFRGDQESKEWDLGVEIYIININQFSINIGQI